MLWGPSSTVVIWPFFFFYFSTTGNMSLSSHYFQLEPWAGKDLFFSQTEGVHRTHFIPRVTVAAIKILIQKNKITCQYYYKDVFLTKILFFEIRIIGGKGAFWQLLMMTENAFCPVFIFSDQKHITVCSDHYNKLWISLPNGLLRLITLPGHPVAF